MNETARALVNVARGLGLIFFSLVLQLLGATLTLLAAFLVVGGFEFPIGPAVLAVHLSIILTTTLFLLGLFYCLGAPVRPGMIAAVGLSALLAGATVFTELASVWPEVRAALGMPLLGMPQEHPVLTLRSTVTVGPLLLMGAHMAFVFFLRSVARLVEDPSLATRALLVLLMQAVVTVTGVGTFLLLSLGGEILRKLPLVGFLWIAGLVMWGLYCFLLLNLRQALLRRAAMEVRPSGANDPSGT